MSLAKKALKTGFPAIIGGFCALLVAMGIGRFAYTALLPDMMISYGIDESSAATMAVWNYIGYLAGVFSARGETHGMRRYYLFVLSLLCGIVATAGMGIVQHLPLWNFLRFLAGFMSGASFVLCSAIVLDTLSAIRKNTLVGFLYGGVGAGIALGGFADIATKTTGSVSESWISMALVSLAPALLALFFMHPAFNRVPPEMTPAITGGQKKKTSFTTDYHILLVVYFLEGFGYIIGATFLVALVKDITGSADLAIWSWIITGFAAAISAPLWRIFARNNYQSMLILAFLLQAAGTLMPLLSTAPVTILLSGLLLGGTFMGITVLALQYGVTLTSKPSAYTVAVLTFVYGIGQIIGPFSARLGIGGGGFQFPFILSGISLFMAALLLIIGSLILKRTSL